MSSLSICRLPRLSVAAIDCLLNRVRVSQVEPFQASADRRRSQCTEGQPARLDHRMLSQMLPRTTIVLALLFMLPFADADAYCNGSVNLARTCFNVESLWTTALASVSQSFPLCTPATLVGCYPLISMTALRPSKAISMPTMTS